MQIDWNPVIHILDELSDGTHSFLELSYMVSHYEREAFTDSLLFLAERDLIELLAGRGPFEPIPKDEWPRRLRDAFGSDVADPVVLVGTSIDLSERGEQVLHLFGIGHP
ncbi:hypothetical protein IAG41_00625 [Sphingomonas sp. JC676]|uniref:hypothetical protein n=1 Tax=Sphingomonas sp. JC676 TaxID=2768065 RepID=UPI0016585690|nr:hypothetical protein [Sphingomonas sp. JC676]MBC9030885.1 hypothetical protein [Sphingomonas sp. JC676]